MGILKSDPDRRTHVFAVTHSFWNDGYSPNYTYTHTKRDVIAAGVNWVQVPSQRLLQSRNRHPVAAHTEKESGLTVAYSRRPDADPLGLVDRRNQ